VVVQARAGSTRLPGKVLMPLAGEPMLAFMLRRLAGVHADMVVVATSREPQDDAVAAVAGDAGVAVVRGSERDVLSRFVDALDQHPAEVVVRLTADCPLVDPILVNEALAVSAEQAADYTSNTLVRTYPDGLDVEVVRASALRDADREATDPAEREHVTPFVYRRPERYRLAAVVGPEQLGRERWTVDTIDDLTRVREIVDRLTDPLTAGWQEILAVAGRGAAVAAGQLTLRPAGAGDGPGIRSWVAERDGNPAGWAQVTVRGGVGRLACEVHDAADDGELRELVRVALSADFQVRELVTEQSTHEGSRHG
jgi:spore coat polysaccharide biosynthesis protein SpsF